MNPGTGRVKKLLVLILSLFVLIKMGLEEEDKKASQKNIYITGAQDQEETEEQKKSREKYRDQHLAEYEASGFREFRDKYFSGIHDKGDYFKISRGQGTKNPQTKERSLSDKQLRIAIMAAVLKKGYDKLYFYNDTKIDSELTSRAPENAF